MKYWLMKSEPEVFSIDNLKTHKTTLWEGVRNYQARNFIMNEMKPGDQVLFYHSNATPSGIAGIAEISKPAIPDPTQFDKKSEYFDPKAKKEKPIWFCVEVKYQEKFKNFIPLETLKSTNSLAEMLVIRKGQRLSIQPVNTEHFEIIKKLGSK